MRGHAPERFSPAFARAADRADDQGVALNHDLHVLAQAGLIDQRLWDANPARVAHADDARFHGVVLHVV